MTDIELKDIDPEDIEDLIVKAGTSFGIKFRPKELAHIKTFGQFCDYITDKITLNNSSDCTSQQAFYRLRDILSSKLQLDKDILTTDYPLVDLFPRENRRSRIKLVEKHLGFNLNILHPPFWVILTLVATLVVSGVVWFYFWQAGLIGVSASIIALWLSFIFGNEIDLLTMGQLAEKMTKENYLKSRRNPQSVNKSEIEKVLVDIFSTELLLEKSKLTRDATFY